MYLLHNRSLTSDMHRDDKTEQVSMVIVQYLPFYIKPNLEGKKTIELKLFSINKKPPKICISHQEIFVSHQVNI